MSCGLCLKAVQIFSDSPDKDLVCQDRAPGLPQKHLDETQTLRTKIFIGFKQLVRFQMPLRDYIYIFRCKKLIVTI